LQSKNLNENLIKYYTIEKNFNPNLKVNHIKFDEKPIDVDYNSSTDIIVINKNKNMQLRNPHYFDEELKEKEFKGDPFGNPFRRCKEDLINEKNVFNNNLAVIDIGEKYRDFNTEKIINSEINEREKNEILFQINNSVFQKKTDDDLSVFPVRINKKRSRSALNSLSNSNNKLNLSFLQKKNKFNETEEEILKEISEENKISNLDCKSILIQNFFKFLSKKNKHKTIHLFTYFFKIFLNQIFYKKQIFIFKRH